MKVPSGQFKTGSQARPRKKQHTSPCADCPFARKSLPGWLGSMTAGEWMEAVHGEAKVDCHTVSNQQCAGSAVFRGNICKSPRTPDILKLPADRVKVFSWDNEFIAHHEQPSLRMKDKRREQCREN